VLITAIEDFSRGVPIMGVVRGLVFPAVRIALWAVIALSLVWLAFFRADPMIETDASATSATR
jgi:hypothetical protein